MKNYINQNTVFGFHFMSQCVMDEVHVDFTSTVDSAGKRTTIILTFEADITSQIDEIIKASKLPSFVTFDMTKFIDMMIDSIEDSILVGEFDDD